jgi:4-hydroxy-tetrahydrodipicolinate synthase
MLFTAEFPNGFREAAKLRGIDAGLGRQPQSPVQQRKLEELRTQLQCLLAAEGFTDEPVGGCRAGDNVDQEQVARIVLGVVGELRKRGF